MNDKTLVEMLREVDYGHANHTHCQIADVLGIRCEGKTCDECGESMAHKLADTIEWEYMPRPHFSNNEPIHFGDWFTAEKYGVKEPEQLKRLCIFSPELLREWKQDDGDKFAFELNYTRPADLDFKFDKCEEPEPDSLERIEEDAEKRYDIYWKCSGINCSECPAVINGKKPDERYETIGDCLNAQKLDLLYRQRKVLERD